MDKSHDHVFTDWFPWMGMESRYCTIEDCDADDYREEKFRVFRN